MAMSKIGFKSARRDQGFDPIKLPGVPDQLRQNFERQEKGIAAHEKALADIRSFNVKQKLDREKDEAELRLETVAELSETAKRALDGIKSEYDRRRQVDALDKATRQVHTQQELDAAEAEYESAKKQSDKVLEQAAKLAYDKKKAAAAKAVSAFKKLDVLQHISIEEHRLEQLGSYYEMWSKQQFATNNTTEVPLGDGTTTTPVDAFKGASAANTAAASAVLRREFLEKYAIDLAPQAATALGVQMNTVDAAILSKAQVAEDQQQGIADRENYLRTYFMELNKGDATDPTILARTIERIGTTPGIQNPGLYMGRNAAASWIEEQTIKAVENGILPASAALSLKYQQHPVVKGKTYGQVWQKTGNPFEQKLATAIYSSDKTAQQQYDFYQSQQGAKDELRLIDELDADPTAYNVPTLEREAARLQAMNHTPYLLKNRISEMKLLGGGATPNTQSAKSVKKYLMSRVYDGTWNEGLFQLAMGQGYTEEAMAAKKEWEKPTNIAPLKSKFEGMDRELLVLGGFKYLADPEQGFSTPAGQAFREDLRNMAIKFYRDRGNMQRFPDSYDRANQAVQYALTEFEKGKTDETSPFYYIPANAGTGRRTYPNYKQALPYEQGTIKEQEKLINERLENNGVLGRKPDGKPYFKSYDFHTELYENKDEVVKAAAQYTNSGTYDSILLHYFAKYRGGHGYASPFDLLKKVAGHHGIELTENPNSKTDRLLAGLVSSSTTSTGGTATSLGPNPTPPGTNAFTKKVVASAEPLNSNQLSSHFRTMLNFPLTEEGRKEKLLRQFPQAGPGLLQASQQAVQGLQTTSGAPINYLDWADVTAAWNSAHKSATFLSTSDLGNMGRVAPSKRGPHADAKLFGPGGEVRYFEYDLLGKYIQVKDPELGFVPMNKVPQTGDWASHKPSSHGRDYGTWHASNLYITPGSGATFKGYKKGPNGEDIAVIDIPEGTLELRHGFGARSLQSPVDPTALKTILNQQLESGLSTNKAWAETIRILLPNKRDQKMLLHNLTFLRAPGRFTMAMYQHLGL